MKMVFRVGMLLAAAALSDVAAANFDDCRCGLREVVRICGPGEFSCRVQRFAGVENLKLRITVRGVEFSSEPAEIRALENRLGELLEGTETLELSNIEDKGYFRLLADVKADGVDVKAYLEEKSGDKPRADSKPESQKAKQIQNTYIPLSRAGNAGRTAAIPGKPPVLTRNVEDLLQTRADLSGLAADTPLKEALETWSGSVRPAIPVIVLWNDLETNALLEPQTPIGIGGMGTMPAGQALDLMLRSVGVLAAERPVAVVEGSVVTIGTARTLRPRYQNRIYPVSQLTMPPVWISDMMGGLQGAGNLVYR